MNGVNITAPIDVQPIVDDRLLTLGTDGDGVLLLRSTILAADTALTGVLVGTVEAQALAANSVMVANVTSNGDIAFYVNKGGNSQMGLWLDGSTGDTAVMAASGASVDHYIAGVKVLDHSSGAFAFQEATTVSGVRDIFGDGAGNHNIYGNAALTDATARTVSINVLDTTGDAWKEMVRFTPDIADPYVNFPFKVGIATLSEPGSILDISGNTIVLGSDADVTTRTDSTQKQMRLAVPHYLSAEEVCTQLASAQSATDNITAVGGGVSTQNAATKVLFFTAANYNTLTGTQRMEIGSGGGVGIGTSPYATQPAGSLGVAAGVMIGANSLDNLIDDASGGAASTPLYIGNRVILVGNGISFGPAAVVSITVVNGQITAIS